MSIEAWKSAALTHFIYKTDVPPNIAAELADAAWDNVLAEHDGDVTAAALSNPHEAVES